MAGMNNARVKALVCKLGLDTHWRGSIIVAHILRNAGMDVVYIGNSTPKEIIDTVIDEDVDLVGVSSLGGAHLTLGTEIIDLAKRYGLLDTKLFLIGGVIPPDDEKKLLEIGFKAVFGPGATEKEIIEKIRSLLPESRKN